MSLFGIREQREIDYLQELIVKYLEDQEKILNKVVRLEQTLIERDTNISLLHTEIAQKTTSFSLLTKKLEETQELVVVLEEAVKSTSRPKHKRKQQLSHKTGFTKVSADESLDMYEQYKAGIDVDKIAQYLDRSQSCVSRHIRRQLEEEETNGRNKQMEDLSGPEDAGIETQEQSSGADRE